MFYESNASYLNPPPLCVAQLHTAEFVPLERAALADVQLTRRRRRSKPQDAERASSLIQRPLKPLLLPPPPSKWLCLAAGASVALLAGASTPPLRRCRCVHYGRAAVLWTAYVNKR
ncbi:hypothetical protein LSAT2_017086 [Lamellibrachia satsuma]|nr:hypothetical protein LSAT2_017086 [Lamellibrachia satsuma]